MEKKTRRIVFIVAFCLIILLQVFRIIYWGNQKESFYEDEYYTYDFSINAANNLPYEDGKLRWDMREDFSENYHTHQEFMKRFHLQPEDSMFRLSPLQVVKQFAVKGTYYVIFNYVMSVIPGDFSIWYGIGINIVIFVLTQIVLFFTAKELFDDVHMAFTTIILYGVCGGAITSIIYVRFYMLFTFCALATLFFHVRLIRQHGKRTLNILLAILFTIIGFRNAEYMILYAFSLGVCYLLYLTLKKRWKDICVYVGSYFAVGIVAIIYFVCNIVSYENVINGQGNDALEHLKTRGLKEYINYLREYYRFTQMHTWGSKIALCIMCGIILVAALAIIKKNLKNNNSIEILIEKADTIMIDRGTLFVMLGSTIGYYLLLVKIVPSYYWRYISNMFPVVIIIITAFLGMFLQKEKRRYIMYGFCAIYVCYMILSGEQFIGELHHGITDIDRNEVLEKCGNQNYLFIDIEPKEDKGGHHKSVYYSSYCWPDDTEVYVTKIDQLLSTETYIAPKGEIMVWVYDDTWTNEKEEIMKRLDKCNSELVFELYATRYKVYKCY